MENPPSKLNENINNKQSTVLNYKTFTEKTNIVGNNI